MLGSPVSRPGRAARRSHLRPVRQASTAKKRAGVALAQLSLLVLVALLAHGCAATSTSVTSDVTRSDVPTTVTVTTSASASDTTTTTTASITTAPPASTSTTATSESGPPSASAIKASATKVSPSIVSVIAKYASGEEAAGPGVVYTADGLILTTVAVVASEGKPAASLSVKFSSGERIPATVVGQDATRDLAVIKVQEANLSPIVFGGAAKVGDWVILVPWNAAVSAFATPVTGLAAQFPTTPPLTGLLQVDGASGMGYGAVIDAQGNLVGLVVGYVTATKAVLAVPADSLLTGAKQVTGK